LDKIKTILITGASGFVGQSLALALKKEGSFNIRLATRNIHRLPSAFTDFEKAVVSNLSSETQWSHALKDCSCVIHTAGRVHVSKKNDKDAASEYLRVNVEGTLHLARQAVQAKVSRFIYFSSIKVNGEVSLNHSPFSADDQPAPMDAYSISKYQAEEALKKLAIATGLELVIIRPPLIYGPGVKGNFKIMLRWLHKGYPVLITKLDNKRSFVSINNLSSLVALCIDHPAAVNQTFLVSDGVDLSTPELLNSLGDCLNKPARLVYIPPLLLTLLLTVVKKRSVMDRLYGSLQVDIEKTKRLLNWTPQHDLKDMLKETVAAYIEQSS